MGGQRKRRSRRGERESEREKKVEVRRRRLRRCHRRRAWHKIRDFLCSFLRLLPHGPSVLSRRRLGLEYSEYRARDLERTSRKLAERGNKRCQTQTASPLSHALIVVFLLFPLSLSRTITGPRARALNTTTRRKCSTRRTWSTRHRCRIENKGGKVFLAR